MHAAAVAIMLGLLDAFSAPNFFFPLAAYFLFLWVLLIFIWLLRAVLYQMSNRRYRRSHYWRTTWRAWAIGPALLLITFGLISFEVPVLARFAVSRAALTRLALHPPLDRAAMAKQNWATEPVLPAGAFKVAVQRVWADGEVDFRVPGTEFLRSFGGFTYSPAAPPADDPGSLFEPLSGPWYIWHKSW
jgi:hypothetical protein